MRNYPYLVGFLDDKYSNRYLSDQLDGRPTWPEWEVTNAATNTVISVADVKNELRAGQNQDDSMIESFIHSATNDIQNYTNRVLLQQEITAYWFRVVDFVQLPVVPFVSITSVTSTDYEDNDTTLTSSDYVLYGLNKKKIRFDTFDAEQLTVVYQAGYGNSPNDVPHALKDAVLEQIPLYYQRFAQARGEVVINNDSGLVAQAEKLARPYRFIHNEWT